MDGINFELLKLKDYKQYMKVINEFRKTDLNISLERFKDAYDKIFNVGGIIIAKHDDNIIASVTFLIEQKIIFNCAKCAHIEDTIVIEKYRKLGIGKMMIKNVIEKIKEYNCYKITLACSDENIDFYKKCGFEIRGNQMSLLLK